MFLNPDHMTTEQMRRVDRWLLANGCRHHVALEPVVLRGNVVEYTALCRRDAKSELRMRVFGDDVITEGRKRLRIRVPLSRVA